MSDEKLRRAVVMVDRTLRRALAEESKAQRMSASTYARIAIADRLRADGALKESNDG